ncbi:MAG: tetratricopeptide repeat protein [Armatimonadetes bacterium]|nr:tetratricopeptide repeat protein [Armatimonadota bacterium]
MKNTSWQSRSALNGLCYALVALGVLPVGASFAASPVLPGATLVLPAALAVGADNKDPNFDPDYLYLQAISQESARYRTGDGSNFRKAIKLYDEALKRRKNFYDAIYHKAVCNYYLKDYDNSIGDATKHIELRPEIMQAYVIRAQSYVKKQDYDPALADLNEVEKKRPDLMEYRLRGQIYYARDGYPKAAEDFETYIASKTDSKGRIDLDAIVAFLDLGNTYGKIGDNDKAVDAYSRYITAYPELTTPWFQRGDPEYDDLPLALNKRGSAYLDIARVAKDPDSPRLEEAAGDFQKLTELQPASPTGYIGLGNVALFRSEWDEAVKSLDKAVALAPQNDSALSALAEARRLQAGEKIGSAPTLAGAAPSATQIAGVASLQQSIREQDDALKINPNNALALRGRALSNANPAIGNYAGAIADFTQLLTVLPAGDPGIAEAYFNRGSAYVNSATPDYAKAVTDFDAAIAANPANSAAYTARGDAYAKLGQYDQAIADYNRVIADTAVDEKVKLAAQRNRGVSYIAMTPPRVKEAIADFEAYLQVYGDDQGVKDSLFAAQLQLGAEDQLIALNRRIGDEPTVADNYLKRAAVYDKLKQTDNAITDYIKVTELDPTNAVAYQNLAADYALKGYSDPAIVEGGIAANTKLIALRPTDPTYLLARGDLYVGQNKYIEAAKDYEAALALIPATDAKRADVQYQIANLYLGAKDNARAKQEFDAYFVAAQASHPKYEEALILRGDLLRDAKDYPGAIADYSKFLVNKPTDVKVLKVRGQAYLDSKDETNALADFEAAIAGAPNDAQALTLASNIYYNQGVVIAQTDPDKASVLFRKAAASTRQAITSDPAFAGAYFYKGVALADNVKVDNITPVEQKAQREEALAALEKFVELAPTSALVPDAQKTIAELKKKLGA